MLDLGLLATVFIVSACVLTYDLIQEDHGYVLLMDSLYAKATEAVKSHTALWASSSKLISILGDMN
jgi:hypothetical protein